MKTVSTLAAMNVLNTQDSPGMIRNLTEALDSLTHAAEAQLGLVTETSSLWGMAFYMGDGLQRSVTDGVFNLLRPQTWNPVNLWRWSSGAVEQTLRLSNLLNPEQVRLAWQELKNKLQVFTLVKSLSSILQLPADQLLPLPELVNRAYSVSPFAALWTVEGLGHYYTDLYLDKKGIPSGLLSEKSAQVPQKSLLMLHAGMGLAFGSRLLETLDPDAVSDSRTRAVVQEFVSLCRQNARPGYLGAAIESLGLVTRDFYPDLLNTVHQQLQEMAPELTGFFWHGAGRALYFSREYFLPILGTVWSGIDEEVKGCAGQESAMAGLAWAVTLVNMNQPAIMENVLGSQVVGSPLLHAFTNGVVSSIIMRQDTTPDVPFVQEFYQHQPRDPRQAAVWEQRIEAPTQRGLHTFYPALRQHHALDQVFRYQDLATVVSQLQQ